MRTRRFKTNDAILPSGLTIRGDSDPVLYRKARELLAAALRRSWMDTAPFVARRYTFTLLSDERTEQMAKDFRKTGELLCYYGECDFYWAVVAKGGRASKVLIGPEGYEREVFAKVFKYPRTIELVDEVPDDPDLVFRGMSSEEYFEIQQSGYVRSRGWYNFTGQEGLTCFGYAGQAQHYANGFTPWMFKPSAEYPGIVVAIPKNLTISSRESKHVPEGERAVRGRIPVSAIEQVWAIVPMQIRYVKMEMIYRDRNGSTELYGNSPSVEAKATRIA